ncbi:hypothetical protein K439DRAFT_1613989 [Ramaria rubella]|nr:hypothetical protein K439DRAFT_1613989 [Ramaria rubella]
MASNDGCYCDYARHCKHCKKIPEFLGGSETTSSSLGTPNAGAEALKWWLEEEDVKSWKCQAIDVSEEADLQDILGLGINNNGDDLFQENDSGETFKVTQEHWIVLSVTQTAMMIPHSGFCPWVLVPREPICLRIHLPPPQDLGFTPGTNVDVDFEPAFDKLKIAMDFIKAIKAATLDNGDLSESVVLWLRNPPDTY